MVTLKDEISSQENMEQWMSQLGHPENPISNKGVLVRLQPQFVSCDFEKRENCIAFAAPCTAASSSPALTLPSA